MTDLQKLSVVDEMYRELLSNVERGVIDIDFVHDSFRQLLACRRPVLTPYIDFELMMRQQYELVNRLNRVRGWGFDPDHIPPAPDSFVPQSSSEVPLLCVYLHDPIAITGLTRTLRELRDLAKLSMPESECISSLMSTESDSLSIVGRDWVPGIRWVGYDPSSHIGVSPSSLLTQDEYGQTLAHIEVLMAAVLMPDMANLIDGNQLPFPYLGGMRCTWHTREYLISSHMCVDRFGHFDLHTEIDSQRGDPAKCTPTVRDLVIT